MRFLKLSSLIMAISFLAASAGHAAGNCVADQGPYRKDITREISGVLSKENGNVEILTSADSSEVIKIKYPKGSYDPASMVAMNLPIGGVNLRYEFNRNFDCLYLSYELKFPQDFDFVKGGKLPGLYGGHGNTGGNIPDGYDGFSTRFLWLPNGGGALYSYLPTSKKWGTAFGKNMWDYGSGQWHRITQRIELNTPEKADGVIEIWLDDNKVYHKDSVVFRYTDRISISGVLFSSFFGGNNKSFSSNKDTFISVRNISISNYLTES